jgi:hypothetical protein
LSTWSEGRPPRSDIGSARPTRCDGRFRQQPSLSGGSARRCWRWQTTHPPG